MKLVVSCFQRYCTDRGGVIPRQPFQLKFNLTAPKNRDRYWDALKVIIKPPLAQGHGIYVQQGAIEHPWLQQSSYHVSKASLLTTPLHTSSSCATSSLGRFWAHVVIKILFLGSTQLPTAGLCLILFCEFLLNSFLQLPLILYGTWFLLLCQLTSRTQRASGASLLLNSREE